MQNKQNVQIPQQAFDWYDEYAHGGMDRRTFLNKLGTLSVVGLSLSVISSALIPNYALAQQVSFNDSDISATYASFDSPTGHGRGEGYLVVPTNKTGLLPVVLVIHENRGLNPYIKDVARRLAKEGYIAFAPDILATLGGYPGNDDDGRAMQKGMDKVNIEQDFIAAAQFLKQHANSNGNLGAVGFCFGGYIVNFLAAAAPDLLTAGVPFYGTPASANIRQNIKAPLLLQYAELDKRVNKSWPDYQEDLNAINAVYTKHMYLGANHGFHNDSTSRYNEIQAKLAWERTLDFFKVHLA